MSQLNFFNHLVIGALGGLASAILVDVDAWKATPSLPFNWNKALHRWAYGVITGLVSSLAGSGVMGVLG